MKCVEEADRGVAWPSDIELISLCRNSDHIQFEDTGALTRFACNRDCFLDKCLDVLTDCYYAWGNCKFFGHHSNSFYQCDKVELFHTKVGLASEQRRLFQWEP